MDYARYDSAYQRKAGRYEPLHCPRQMPANPASTYRYRKRNVRAMWDPTQKLVLAKENTLMTDRLLRMVGKWFRLELLSVLLLLIEIFFFIIPMPTSVQYTRIKTKQIKLLCE